MNDWVLEFRVTGFKKTPAPVRICKKNQLWRAAGDAGKGRSATSRRTLWN
jgi:hypothetical protein